MELKEILKEQVTERKQIILYKPDSIKPSGLGAN